MKKSLLFLCLSGLILLSSCGDQRVVNRTARAFLQSLYIDNDFEAAKVVSTRMTHENIDMRALMFRINPNSMANRFGSFEIDDKEIRNTKAVIFYTLDGNVRRQLNLSKVDGVWLVDMPEHISTSPVFSISPVRSEGGFASATSEPIRLRDVPTYDPTERERENR